MYFTDLDWGKEIKFNIHGDINKLLPFYMNGSLDYDGHNNTFFLNNTSVEIENNENIKKQLREFSSKEHKPYIIQRISNNNSDGVIPYCLKYFYDARNFNEYQKLSIHISEKLIEQILRNPKNKYPVTFLNEQFFFNHRYNSKDNGDRIAFATRTNNLNEIVFLSQEYELLIQIIHNQVNAVELRERKIATNPVYLFTGKIEFIEHTIHNKLTEQTKNMLVLIQTPGSFMERIEAYNELEKLYEYKRALEDKSVHYISYKLFHDLHGFQIEHSSNFETGEEVNWSDGNDKIPSSWDELIKNNKDVIKIGSVIGQENQDNQSWIYIKGDSPTKKFPAHGYLIKSIAGSKVMMQRREKAIEKINLGLTPIPYLGQMIESIVSDNIPTQIFNKEQALTDYVETHLEEMNQKKTQLDNEQIKAISIAINTPDLALIQGPPGTGKTTVIKAIILRYEELYKKQNNGSLPRILITSYQHEAVDNAIQNPFSSGLPALRKGGVKGEKTQKDNVLRWVAQEKQKYPIDLKNNTLTSHQYYITLKNLEDHFDYWCHTGKKVENARKIILDIQNEFNSILPKKIIESIDLFNNKINQHFLKSSLDETNKQDFYNQLLGLFDAVPLNNRTVKRIVKLIQNHDEVGIKLPDCLKEIFNNNDQDNIEEQSIDSTIIMDLKKQIIRRKSSNTEQDYSLSQDCLALISQILREMNFLLKEKLLTREEKTSDILQNYLDRLDSFSEVTRIIQNYANVEATTCQQSLDLGSEIEYDLVIVDEAARANPSDILIPMSIGKKVILVGDQNQLPHFIYPEIVQSLEKDKKIEELEVLKMSFFERMYTMFEKNNHGDNIMRTCRLKQQYRMEPSISNFISHNFYNDTLQCGIVDLIDLKKPSYFNKGSMYWIEISQSNYGFEKRGKSKSREIEATKLIGYLKAVVHEMNDAKIGIISFYRDQVDIISNKINETFTEQQKQYIQVGTVDSFQGKEFDIVFLSCVRANKEKEWKYRVGFLNDPNRLCVAMSRAKQLLIIIGDQETVRGIQSLKNYIENCIQNGCYRDGSQDDI